MRGDRQIPSYPKLYVRTGQRLRVVSPRGSEGRYRSITCTVVKTYPYFVLAVRHGKLGDIRECFAYQDIKGVIG